MKFAIFVLAKEDEMAKFAHALMYANELHQAGHEVKIIFDGASVKTLAGLDPEKPVFKLYTAVKELGIFAGVCEFCTTRMEVDQAENIVDLIKLNNANGHASIAQYVAEGYTPLVM